MKLGLHDNLLFLAKCRTKRVYNLIACVVREWILASCKLATLICTCIYPMVYAMTSYSSLTSGRIFFISRQHSTESDFSSMTRVFMKIWLVSLPCVSKRRAGGGGGGGGWWVLFPYIGYIGMCGAKGYGFLAVLFWSRVSISQLILFYFIRFGNYWQSHRNSMTPITVGP